MMQVVSMETEQPDTMTSSDMRYEMNKRKQIVRAAREMSLEKGFTHITIMDIANKVGMTRSLFYHYFKNKDAVAEAVLDEDINEIIARINTWNETREEGNVDKALTDIVQLMRDILNDEGPFSQRMVQSGNAELYIRFVDQVSRRVADYIERTTAEDFVRVHGELPVKHLHETLIMLISGSIAMLRKYPQTANDTIIQILAQTLHLEPYLDDCPHPDDSASVQQSRKQHNEQ
jgi:TetR/AcrR family transcriptional regulator